MNVLGIETSCDETAAAVVRDGREILSSIVSSQVELHGPYGGVVPEIASRSHVEKLPGVVDEAVRAAGLQWQDVDAVAVTVGPGLASSLLVGLSAAKGLCLRLGKPLIPVNHLEAHLYSVFLGADAPGIEDVIPFKALVVSGGHTCIVDCGGVGDYRILGQTVDDAAGEAFDKGANLLGLGYPGGPVIDRLSREGDPTLVDFPRARIREGSEPKGMRADCCFSFSGVKTALLYHLKKARPAQGSAELASTVASYQEAIVDSLVRACECVVGEGSVLALCGGVALNSRLRARLAEMTTKCGARLLLAKPAFCGDNAAMIAGLAGAGGCVATGDGMAVDAMPNLGIGDAA